MKISVTCSSKRMALELISLGVETIEIGIKNFSCRFNSYFDLEELEELIKNIESKKIIVVLNDIYFEQQLFDLEKIIINIVSLGIDKIKFHDFAVPQIVYENKLKIKLSYSPETMNTNYGQIDFLYENGINSLDLSSELTYPEMKKIALNKKQMEICVKIHGLGFVMHSRWPIISNFETYANIQKKEFKKTKYLLIKEELRKYPNIIYEDNSGTHMMTGYYICAIKKIPKLQESLIDVLKIDSLFIEDKNLLDIVKFYIEVNNTKNIDEKHLESIYEKIKTNSSLELAEHFFNIPKGLLHMEKEVD